MHAIIQFEELLAVLFNNFHKQLLLMLTAQRWKIHLPTARYKLVQATPALSVDTRRHQKIPEEKSPMAQRQRE